MRPADRRSFVALTAADVDRYAKGLRDDPKALLNPDLSGIKGDREREEARSDVEQLKKVYSPENLLAGAEILKAGLSDEFGLAAKEKKLYFARHGYIGWILAYVAERRRDRSSRSASDRTKQPVAWQFVRSLATPATGNTPGINPAP